MTVKSSISLGDEQHAFAKALVDSGRYASLGAVMRQGIDLLRRRTEAEEHDPAVLRALLARRREGEFVDAERMDERLVRMLADKRGMYGLPS